MKNQNRRKFLQQMGLAGISLAGSSQLIASSNSNSLTVHSLKSTEPIPHGNDGPVRIGLIGAGGMGVEDAKTALLHDGVVITAVCDLYKGRIEAAQKRWGGNLFATTDYKELLKRSDVDAVIIGTPDHWHMPITVDALLSGKHVYVEKPMVHSVGEGMKLMEAWKKSGKICMVGSQGLSSLGNEKARELLESGAIGELNYAEGFWARMSPEGAWQYKIPEDASTQTVDWGRYEIQKKHAYDPLRFFRWRNYLDYGTGMSGDLFVHLFSSLHFITGSMGPNKIAAMGGLRYWKDGRDVPDVLLGMFDYPQAKEHPAFNLSLRCNFVDGTSGTTYLKLVGSKGSMDVKWEEVVVRLNAQADETDPFLAAKAKESGGSVEKRARILPPREMVYKAESNWKGAHYDHFGNWLRAIRQGGTVVEDPVFGFRACAPALLCNDSYFKGSFINWDPVAMKVV
ncbi:MAG: Gfo/Idh/MocA family oxidoreductase [Chitinophagaceae bacterium]|nr:Gfo/Idh/MocA family oxidoreductase [Chitinophagaceae bacterium]